MIPRRLHLGLLLAALFLGVRTGAQDALLTDTNSRIFYPTNFWDANISDITNALQRAGFTPTNSPNAVLRSGDTMTGSLAIVASGVGMVAVGSTNNPAAPVIAIGYDGAQFELGEGSLDPVALNDPWLTVQDGVSALWTIPMSAPSFTGAHAGDGSAITNLAGGAIATGTVADARIASTIARDSEVDALVANRVSKTGDTMTGGLGILTPGVGLLAVGSTNNPAAPAVVLSYDGSLFEMGDGSVDPIALNTTWLVVEDSVLATWSIPMVVPSLLIGPTNVISAIGGKQPYAAPLVPLSTNNAAAVTNLNASELRSGTVPVERLASNLQAFATNGVTGPLTLSATEAPGSSNRLAATTEFVAKAVYGVSGGGGTGNASTNVEQNWSAKQTFAAGIDAPGTNNLGVIHATAIESDLPIAQSIGGTGGTDAETARSALGLRYDEDVMVFYPALKQIAQAMLADGHMPVRSSGGGMTNTPSLAFGRGLLNTTDAAAVRALIGAVYGSGDTMTGQLRLPTYAYDAATWTNGSRTNEAATRVDVATKIEQLAIGGAFFSSVSSDFTNAAGQLQFAPEATAGTGKLLRETAAGTNTQLAGLTDVTISTPIRGQSLVYDGTKWGNGVASAMDASDYWIEHFTPIISGAAGLTEARVPFTTSQLNSGVVTMNATYAGRNGVITFSGKAATNQFTGGSIGYTTGQAVLNPTNVLQYKADIILVLTNDLWGRIGYTDQANTNDPTDALMFTTTNGVVFGMACQGGFANRTQTSTSFIASSNVWYSFRIFMTNSTAWFRIYTNQTQLAWQESITSNVPGNGQYFGPWAMAECGGAGSTNKILMGVDTFGHRFSVQ